MKRWTSQPSFFHYKLSPESLKNKIPLEITLFVQKYHQKILVQSQGIWKKNTEDHQATAIFFFFYLNL